MVLCTLWNPWPRPIAVFVHLGAYFGSVNTKCSATLTWLGISYTTEQWALQRKWLHERKIWNATGEQNLGEVQRRNSWNFIGPVRPCQLFWRIMVIFLKFGCYLVQLSPYYIPCEPYNWCSTGCWKASPQALVVIYSSLLRNNPALMDLFDSAMQPVWPIFHKLRLWSIAVS
jgi:hypothetical protein